MSTRADVLERLERFRSYLHLLARMHLGPRWHARHDPSDLVQQTMVRAVAAAEQFRGHDDAELAGWLRRILARTPDGPHAGGGSHAQDAGPEAAASADRGQAQRRAGGVRMDDNGTGRSSGVADASLAQCPHIYQIGNNADHVFAYRAFKRRPGILVQHDFNLHYLVEDATLAVGDGSGYREVLYEEYGDAGAALADLRQAGLFSEAQKLALPLNTHLLRRATAVYRKISG